MGVYLSSPDTKKHSLDYENGRIRVGVSAMQGWRLNMEDAHITELDFDIDTSLFAVFDGHGGEEVAKFCAKKFGSHLKKNQKYQMGKYEDALIDTFLLMDKLISCPEGQAELRQLKTEKGGEMQAGCTANVLLMTKEMVYCANAGDSRSVLYSNRKKFNFSHDHKPDNPTERSRIQKAGGVVQFGRVNGNLN